MCSVIKAVWIRTRFGIEYAEINEEKENEEIEIMSSIKFIHSFVRS